MKYILLSVICLSFLGCSTAQLQTAWSNTKYASYAAATDPVTWAPLATGVTLYATGADDHMTDYIMKNNRLTSENDEIYREINGIETYATALQIKDKEDTTKLKRVIAETVGFNSAKITTNILSSAVDKENPSHTGDNAIGSHHALDPFAGSAMNRRNVAQLDIPTWGKYTLNGISYFTAASSALIRVQDGGHSLGDQLVSASIGNFIGLFFHDLLMREDTRLNVSLYSDSAYLYAGWSF